jgi:hypothetical protein
MKLIVIFCCWMIACLVAIYKTFIGAITPYEMMIPIIAFMVYLMLLYNGWVKERLYK